MRDRVTSAQGPVVTTPNRVPSQIAIAYVLVCALFVSVLIFTLSPNSSAQQAGALGWSAQDTKTLNDLDATSFSDELNGFAVGEQGTILRTTDGGEAWTLLDGGSDWHLRDVIAMNDTQAIAVGDDGAIVYTDDGGDSWQQSHVCRTTLGEEEDKDVQSCAQVADAVNEELNEQLTVDSNFQAIHGIDAEVIAAVADDGTIIMVSEDGPIEWTAIPNVAHATETPLNSVWFVDDETGFAVGDDGTILKTEDGGETWQLQFACDDDEEITRRTERCLPGPEQITKDLYSVAFSNEDEGIIVGQSGTILTMTDDDDQWMAQDVGDTLNEVALNGSTGYAVGKSGTILATTDGGVEWTPMSACLLPSTPCPPAGRVPDLNGISLPHTTIATAVGDRGVALRLEPQPTPTPTASATSSGTASPSQSVSPSVTPTQSASASPTARVTPFSSPSPTEPPPPEAESYLTVEYGKKKFSGVIASSQASCWQLRTIKVKRVKKGKDQTVVTATSSSEGEWSMPVSNAKKGRYYAVATKTVTETATCVRARSPQIRVNR